MKEIDFQDLLIDAWNKFKERWKPLCVASLVGYFLPLVIFVIASFIVMSAAMNSQYFGQSFSISSFIPMFVGGFLLLVASFMLTIGTENYCMKICRGEIPQTKDFFLPAKTYFRVIVAELIVSIIVNLGIIICIIPGLLFLFFFSLVSYAIIDHPELGIIDCLKLSWRIVKQNWKPILILDIIVYALQSVIGSTVVGLIPLVPFSILVTSLLYTKFNDEPATTIEGKLS